MLVWPLPEEIAESQFEALFGTGRASDIHKRKPEAWLRYIILHIKDWLVNLVRDLLPREVDFKSPRASTGAGCYT
ncbi:hypothetical protein RSA36_21750 [Pantoea stewartii]|uniref:Transposase n=2 Tax=Pantoea stewartii TaxID=66269 RepID=A0AB34VF69_9GAMM|nr:hypothetical protein RSA30_15430 [Pantoea stewartii]KTS97643.1 hypothetical protein RSA13_11130 [Pantoea stewartii]KTT04919.1 hypothetical protein RSA36_21750 [Pantoea stewartii]